MLSELIHAVVPYLQVGDILQEREVLLSAFISILTRLFKTIPITDFLEYLWIVSLVAEALAWQRRQVPNAKLRHLDVLIATQTVISVEVHVPVDVGLIWLHRHAKYHSGLQQIGCYLHSPLIVHLNLEKCFLVRSVAIDGILPANTDIVNELSSLLVKFFLNSIHLFEVDFSY